VKGFQMTPEQTSIQIALCEKLQHELQQEQVIWYAYPDPTRRAKQTSFRSPFPWWIVSRIIFLLGMLIVVIFTSVLTRTTTFLLIPLYGAMLLFVIMIWIVLMAQRKSAARRRLKSTLYAITTRRLVVITLDRGQFLQNSYVPQDLGRIDLIERQDGWGDVVVGSPRVQSGGYSLAVVSPRLSGVPSAREVAALLTRLKTEYRFAAPHPQA
jgi:hypothetical protein